MCFIINLAMHISVLYIGKAENLRKRIEQQTNNLRLMMGIKIL